MGVLKIVKTVKNIYKEYVVLVKIGKFYYCYGRDSYIISYLTNYKINLLEDNTYSCSFSTNAYNKVISILEDKKINYLILDRRNDYEEDEKYNNKNLNNYLKYYEKAKEEISTKMRIEKIYKYLNEHLLDKETIMKVEKIIYERRKIQSN